MSRLGRPSLGDGEACPLPRPVLCGVIGAVSSSKTLRDAEAASVSPSLLSLGGVVGMGSSAAWVQRILLGLDGELAGLGRQVPEIILGRACDIQAGRVLANLIPAMVSSKDFWWPLGDDILGDSQGDAAARLGDSQQSHPNAAIHMRCCCCDTHVNPCSDTRDEVTPTPMVVADLMLFGPGTRGVPGPFPRGTHAYME